MEESLDTTLENAAGVMHWLGQHRLGNALALLARLLHVHEIHRLDQLEKVVMKAENWSPTEGAPPSESEER